MIISAYKDININEQTVVTIGNFDGVHLGHRFLMEEAKQIALKTGLKSAALTFSPHPREFLCYENFKLITTVYEKELIFNKLDIDYKIFAEFNEDLASLSPVRFVEEILVKALKCRHVVVGENFTFGNNKSGNVRVLTELCKDRMISVDFFASVKKNGRISSNRIRGLLANGDLLGANELLGEPYFIHGEIIRGKSLGRTLGFPTINQTVAQNKLLPRYGVFFTKTVIDGVSYNGITNVGVRPTVGGTERSVETFLFDFDGDVYGKTAIVSFLQRHRDEIKFDSVESLKNAITDNKRTAVDFFRSLEK